MYVRLFLIVLCALVNFPLPFLTDCFAATLSEMIVCVMVLLFSLFLYMPLPSFLSKSSCVFAWPFKLVFARPCCCLRCSTVLMGLHFLPLTYPMYAVGFVVVGVGCVPPLSAMYSTFPIWSALRVCAVLLLRLFYFMDMIEFDWISACW